MRTIIFYGKVLPERADITFSIEIGGKPVKLKVKGPALPEFELTLSIKRSQITVVCFFSEFNEEWIWSLRNIIDDTVRSQVDLIGFMEGCAYQVEITGWVDPDNGCGFPLGFIDSKLKKDSHFPVLPEMLSSDSERASKFIIMSVQDGPLRSALSNCRRALMYANGTGMYCYRAIESLRLGLTPAVSNDEKGRVVQWTELRRRLRFKRSFIQKVEDCAENVRHANEVPLTGEERSNLMAVTWQIVERYMMLRLLAADELPESDYPILS